MTSSEAIDPATTTSPILVVVAQSGYPTTSEALPDWAQLIPEKPTAAWSWSTTKIRYSVGSSAEAEEQAVASPADARVTETSIPVAQGWDLLPGLEDALLVHVCRPYTRAGEIALLAAKALGKRTVLSDLAQATSNVGASFGMATLADCLICESEAEGERYSGHPRLAILDLSSRESWPALSDIYADLLDRGESS